MKKKTKSIKPKKEKVMPIKRQIGYIKAYLTNRGIAVREGEVEDFVSPDLHYEENKAAVMEVYAEREGHRFTDVEALIEQAETIDESRSEKAQLADYHKRSKHTWTPRQMVKDPDKIDKWFNSPNRYDIVGIDVKEGLAVIKRKKVKKKATKKKATTKKKKK